MCGHAIHSRKKVGAERRRETVFQYLDISLGTNKVRLFIVAGSWSSAIISRRVAVFEGICPGPETLTQTDAHRFNEGRIRMARKKVFEMIHIDRSDDLKERRVFENRLSSHRII